jgi:hypothetical protein
MWLFFLLGESPSYFAIQLENIMATTLELGGKAIATIGISKKCHFLFHGDGFHLQMLLTLP